MRAAPLRRPSTILLPALALAAIAALLWLTPADSAQAQAEQAGPPTVTVGPVITSSPASGDTYGEGEAIQVSLTFSQAVTVTGEPRVRLAVGERQRWARYDHARQDGTVLVFAYKVKKVDADQDGVSIKKNQLQLKGGSIQDSDGNAASLEHPALPNQSGHKVDGSPEDQPTEPEPEPTPTPTPTPTPAPEPANSPPQFAADTADRSVNEDAEIGANVGDAITATDADDDGLTYDLTGSDAFAINESTGQVTVAGALDYETTATHTLTVSVSDGKKADGETDAAVDDTIAVTVSVGNVDEAGVVSLDPQTPQAGSPLTASLNDPDGSVTGTAWTWASSADQATWQTIDGATGAAYTPSDDDADHYLRAAASYADGHGPGKTAQSATADAVAAAPATPEPEPAVTAGPAIVSSPGSGDTYGEGEAIVVAVTFSEGVTATGDVRVRLTVGERQRWARYDHSRQDGTVLAFAYKVKKVDADDNGVSIAADQLQLKGGTVTDGDGNAASLSAPALPDQSDHKVDGSQEAAPAEGQQQQQGQRQTTPANNEPRFMDDSADRSVNEDAAIGANVGITVTAADADGDALTYGLSGSDAFAINASTGQITVRAALDYETQAEYTLTVTVHDGKNAAGEADSSVDSTISATITVTNVDEAGKIAFDLDQPRVDSPLTASLTDPDDSVAGVTWAWASSTDGTTWAAISGATQAAYTPSSNDVGNYLRAAASYTDGHGPGKTARGETANPVAAATGTDYDGDDDGLISVTNQKQLAAITLDLDGDGAADDEESADEYQEAFPDPIVGMGCPEATGCVGYELDANLTLAGNWSAIGANVDGSASSFSGTFDGNGNTVSGLSMPTGGNASYTALFAWLGLDGVIRNVGVIAPNIHNSADGPWVYAAGLVGNNQGAVSGSYVRDGTIAASGIQSVVGGLVGWNYGSISGSHASGNVSAGGWASEVGGLAGNNLVGNNLADDGGTISKSHATGNVSASGNSSWVGGLVGNNNSLISDSHASGNVSASGYASRVGGLTGKNRGLIKGSHSTGNVRTSESDNSVGGLTGENGGLIKGSHASGQVSASGGSSSAVGGLVGENRGKAISNSYASGQVSARDGSNYVGGLVGENHGEAISNSYASGQVSARNGSNYVGGLVGQNHGEAISNSYASGQVSARDGSNYVGGLVGQNSGEAISNSYWDKEATGAAASSGSPESAGKTTAEMKTATGPSSSIYTGWDTDIWDFSDPTDYPTLREPATNEGQATTSEGICDRSLTVQGEILRALRGVKDCTRVTQADLIRVTTIYLFYWEGLGLTRLKAGDFRDLTNLKKLNLGHNRLTALPEGVFDDLTNLRELNLGDNRLTALPEGVFDDLTNLRELYLGHNRLTALPEGVFDDLTNLRELYLGANQLTALPEGVFDDLTNLQQLSLGANQLTTLSEDLFDGSDGLQKLYLSRIQLTTLPEDLFDGLNSLQELSLSANQLTTLSEDLFDGLNSLEELYLDENQLAVLPEELFDGLHRLRELTLQSNKLTALPADIFDGLASLRRLDLQDNKLTALPEGVFNGLTNLEKLYLYDNPGSPFILNAQLERSGSDGVMVKVAEGAPFPINITLSVQGGSLSDTTVVIAAGKTASAKITATPNGQAEVTVSVQSAAFPAKYVDIGRRMGARAISFREFMNRELKHYLNGIQVGRGASLVLR